MHPDPVQDAPPPDIPPTPPSRRVWRKLAYVFAGAVGLGIPAGTGLVVYENHTSHFLKMTMAQAAAGKIWASDKTSNPCVAPPRAVGPYDLRHGYANTRDICKRLLQSGFEQVGGDNTWREYNILGIPLFTLWDEKANPGLSLSDNTGERIHGGSHPQRIYPDFEAIPPLLVDSLLYVENRDLMERGERPDSWNPTVDWPRLLNAAFGKARREVGLSGDASGGSTLATQIEKFRHSPGGNSNDNSIEKLRQLLTAALRYEISTMPPLEKRQKIITDYINGVPLAGYPGFGEVHGFYDGLIWLNMNPDSVHMLLNTPDDALDDEGMAEKGRAFRGVLGLVLAVKAPDQYLLSRPTRLQERVNTFLPLLRADGVISERLFRAAQAAPAPMADPRRTRYRGQRADQGYKGVDSLRIDLLQILNPDGGLYGLDRLDLSARGTIDAQTSQAVAETLRKLNDPDFAAASGMITTNPDERLLRPEVVPRVTYIFTLYEKTPTGNVLRVQEDNYNGPLNLSEGSKLELGSTAKLRTLASYLLAMAYLFEKYRDMPAAELETLSDTPRDPLGGWARAWMANPDNPRDLDSMLNAALNRTYSANPNERFFTSGGLHPPFSNFDRKEDGRIFTVREALHKSNNLAFIRIMRDIVRFTQAHKMADPEDLFTDVDNPVRRAYLERFFVQESEVTLWRARQMQRGRSPGEILDSLAKRSNRDPRQLAALYRSILPAAPYEAMQLYITRNCEPHKCARDNDYRDLYDLHAPGRFDLNDQAYLANLSGRATVPMEIWYGRYRLSEKAGIDAHLALLARIHATHFAAPGFDESLTRIPGLHGMVAQHILAARAANPALSETDSLAALMDAAMAQIPADPDWETSLADSESARRLSYKWLLENRPGNRAGQDTRIHIMREQEAFTHIQKEWGEMGFPFDKMVPSLASALGASGDTPAGLAILNGIIQNGGRRIPARKIDRVIFGANTPFSMEFAAASVEQQARRVMPAEVAAHLKREMQGVVQYGTGRRLRDAVKIGDQSIPVGIKSGTGDQSYNQGNSTRTATATFVIGDYFYGTMTAYINNPGDKDIFTSAAASQALKNILALPEMVTMIGRPYAAAAQQPGLRR